ncbi:dioxygenase [Streptomyces sp. SID1328]|uniref:tryptophan 2,3-dioxygenase family protein n=1 Tax=Streptomyces sp. SID1328 TaxID=2690250 RepID=UPI00136A761B|nr:tryptophan 2,3-dioxygenase family protein [Streptomyces sp. SID1328]MYV38408.1 dioxygenase [Streptomyces sp. SID1328]
MSKYNEYIGFEQLKEAGFVALPVTAESSTKADELHFKRLHMESELSLAQMVTDLECAVESLKPQDDLDQVSFHLHRTAGIMEGMETKLNLLRPPYFTPERFEKFRDLLSPASGAQSPGFSEVRRFLGLEDMESPVFKEFRNAVARYETNITSALRSPLNPLRPVAHAMLRMATAYESWAWSHYQNTRLVVGGTPKGTGGTAGAAYLKDRVVAPFPGLWEAVGVSTPPREPRE